MARSVAAMSAGSPESATQRNGPLPSQNSGRMYGGHEAGEVEGALDCRRAAPRRAGCCRSRTPRRRGPWKPTIASTWRGHRSRARVVCILAVRPAAAPARLPATGRPGRSSAGSWAGVWSVTTSTSKPRATSAGSTSAALPRRPIESARLRLLGIARPGAARAPGHRPGRPGSRCSSRRSMRSRVDLDADRDPAVERDRERLGAAHAAEAGGERDRPGERAAEALARDRGERLVRALQDALRADVDPRAGRHLAVHRQARALRAAGTRPRSPIRARASRWR